MKNDVTIPLIFINLECLTTQRGQDHHIRSSNETHDADGEKFCPHAVEGLDKIIQTYHAELVLIAPWSSNTDSISEIQKLFTNRRLKWKVRDIAINTKKNINRGEAIKLWMKKNGQPERFVIIDGDADFDITESFPGKTVNTNDVDGIADRRCYRRTNSIIKQVSEIEAEVSPKTKSIF